MEAMIQNTFFKCHLKISLEACINAIVFQLLPSLKGKKKAIKKIRAKFMLLFLNKTESSRFRPENNDDFV